VTGPQLLVTVIAGIITGAIVAAIVRLMISEGEE